METPPDKHMAGAERALMRAFASFLLRSSSLFLLFALISQTTGLLSAQTKTFSDTAVPVTILPEPAYSIADVLNQDRSITQYATQSISNAGYACTPAPGLTAQGTTPHAFLNDGNLFEIGPASTGSSLAIAPMTTPYYNGCQYGPLAAIPGSGTAILATSADIRRRHIFVVTGSGGTSAEAITGYDASGFYASSTSALVSLGQASLDTGATYTSMVTDADGADGDTAITELRTSSTAGNLWIYTASGRAVKILAPDGSSLPAVNAFIIHNPNDLAGELLVLANQDGLTASNQSNPPQDTNPFTIIDLGQLHQLITASPNATTLTLPAVTKIYATATYFAMLGAAWNPVNKLLYAVVGGADSSGNIFRHVLTYDPYNPSSPSETTVADVTSIPIAPPYYPQVVLNAAAGSMQFLTQNPTAAYTVSVNSGATTMPTLLGSGTFASDTSFTPTAMAVAPFAGNTWFASSSGKVDALTLPSGSLVQAYLDMVAPLVVPNTGASSVQVYGTFPYNSDTSLYGVNVTVTATKQGGTPFTFGTIAATTARGSGSNTVSGTFPSAGIYTLTANFPGDSVQAAFTSSPVVVAVATPPFTTGISLTAQATSTTAGTASVTLTGSTWVPTGTIQITDASSGATLGSYTFSGPLTNPISIPITFTSSTTQVVATYAGDSANSQSVSPAAALTSSLVTPTLSLTSAATAFISSTSTGSLSFTSSSTVAPTGNITIYTQPFYSTTSTAVATVSAAQAFASGGTNFSFTAPSTSGNYNVYAVYSGDATYAAATSPNSSLAVNAQTVLATTLTVTAPASVSASTLFKVNVALTSATSTQTPTGVVNVTAKLAGSSTSTMIAVLDAGQAYASGGNTFNASLSATGSYTITAVYYGDQNFSAATPGTATVTVGSGPTIATTTMLTAGATQTVGTAFTATIALTSATSSATPTGNVVLTAVNGTGTPFTVATVTAAQALQSGGYAVQITPTASGNYVLTATYAGDGNFNSSTARTPVSVAGVATTVTLQAPATFTAGTAFSAVVQFKAASSTGTAPTGNIIITAKPSSGGAATVVGALVVSQASGTGGYTAQITLPSADSYTLTAAYAGDSQYTASSAVATITSNPTVAPTTLGVSGPSSAFPGISFAMTVNLRAAFSQTAAITGNVTLVAQDTNYGGTYNLGTVSAATALASGSAQLNATIPAAGNYKITATYAGDANYGSSSGSIVVTVAMPTTTLSLSGVTTQSPNVPFTLTVRLTPQPGAPGTPTGNVSISVPENGVKTTLATVTAAQALATGGAQVQVTLPVAGSQTVTATYVGDTNFSNSVASLLINAVTTSKLTIRPVPATLIANTPFQLCVDLTSTTASATPTGSFTLSSIDPNNNSGTYPSISAAGALAGNACTAPFQVSPAGTWMFIASYAGDSNYPPLTTTISLNFQLQATSLTLTGAGTATALVPYSVKTTLVTAATKPDGTIMLSATLNGSTTAVQTIYIDATTALSPVTSFITFPSAGTYTVTETYNGTKTSGSSTATPLTVVVAPPLASSFTLTLDDPSVNTQAGALTLNGTNTTTVTLTTAGAGPGPVTLSASGSYPGVIVFRDATTKKLITSVTPTASGAHVIVEYDSQAPTARLEMLHFTRHPAPYSLAGGLFGLVLLGMRRSRLHRLRRSLHLFGSAAIFLFAMQTIVGCHTSPSYTQVNVTATPVTASTTAPPQSVILLISTPSPN